VPDLAVLGNLARDRIAGGVRVGGGPFHAARGLRRLGTEATIVTKAADRSLLPGLIALGLPVECHEAASQATFGIVEHGDSREMQVEELGEPWTPEDARGWVAEAVGDARWLHIAPLLRSDFPAETLAELARGRRILLDGQGLVRVSQVGALVEDDAYDPDVLRHVAVLKLAEDEASIVLPDLELESIAALGVPEVLVTFGSRGSLVFANGTTERVVARPVDSEAVGAGDAFSAAYLASRAAGYAPVAAAQRGARLVEALLSEHR
jgi:sugar/nucleoside kinase (ribokinase family)